MILAFEFTLNGGAELYATVLDTVAKKFCPKYSVALMDKRLTLFLDDSEDRLQDIADNLSKALPHSIFVRDFRVYATDTKAILKSDIAYKFNIANITPLQIVEFKNSAKVEQNELGVLSDVSIMGDAVNIENFNHLLNLAKECIICGKSVDFSDSFGDYEVGIFDGGDSSFVMPTSLKHIGRAFIADENTQIALASFEKPLLKLRSTAIFRTSFKNADGYFMVGLARDIFTYALCDSLCKENVNFLSFKAKNIKDEKFGVTIFEKHTIVSSGICYLNSNDREFVSRSDDKNFALFALSAYGFSLDKNSSYLRLFLSKHKPDEIELVKSGEPIKLLFINMPKSWEELKFLIASLPEGEKLLQNYQKEFELGFGDLCLKNNFFGLFSLVGLILGLSDDPVKAGDKAINLAEDFGGLKGVRIEFKILNGNEFDVARAVRSAMSFRLAGVGEKNLCFGLVESLTHFLDEFSVYTQSEYNSSLSIGSGSLFSDQALFKLCLKHNKIKFSREYALESGV